MNVLPFSKIRSYVVAVAMLALVGGVGYRLGERRAFGADGAVNGTSIDSVLINQSTPQTANVDFSLFWDVWGRLFEYYIDADKLDKQKMVWGAISGMVSALDDPYTTFLPPKENTDFKQDLGGQFEGIGAQLGMRENRVMVVAPLKGNPAEAAGIRAGDFILKVNGEDTAGWSIQEAVTKIRGERGTTVTLTILHEGDAETSQIDIVRDTINVPSVEIWVKRVSEIEEVSGIESVESLFGSGKRVAYISLTRFGDRTNNEWNEAVSTLVREQASNNPPAGVILDLRNNPGGYLQSSVFIASEFIPDGTVVTQVNSDGSREDFTIVRRGRLLDIPVIVLINEGSASASEIVAGALRDHDRATLVGETSFGKGTVQSPQDLPGGGGLHITTGRWLLPSGSSISDEGINPDMEVLLENPTATTDAQLAKALELLLQ